MRLFRRNKELRQRRKLLRAQMQRRLETARADLRRKRDASPKGRSRRRWWLLALLLLLLLLRDCSCNEPDALPQAGPPTPPAPVVEEPAADPPAPAPPTGRVARRDRPTYNSPAPEPLPWLTSFQMQVSARGPRLAECFVGAHSPGTLKWTAAVELSDGRVSEQTLEPTLLSVALTQQQRVCVLDVLSDPPYRLDGADARSTPSRIAMVIEF